MPQRDISATSASLRGVIGLARRSGQLAWGTRVVGERISEGKAQVVVLAADASPRVRRKFKDLCWRMGIPVVDAPSGAELGRWCGLATLAAAAILDEGLVRSLLRQPDDS